LKRMGSCQQCGKCCQSVILSLGMGHADSGEERKEAADFLRWASLHEGVAVKLKDKDNVEVGYKAKCRMLQVDKDGKCSCLIYENRPDICRLYPPDPNPNCRGFHFVEDGVETVSDTEEVQK